MSEEDPMDRDEARQNPREAVDAIERRIDSGHAAADVGADTDPDPADATKPAFAVDLDPEDQGTAEAAADNPD